MDRLLHVFYCLHRQSRCNNRSDSESLLLAVNLNIWGEGIAPWENEPQGKTRSETILQPCCYAWIHAIKSSLLSGAVNSGIIRAQGGCGTAAGPGVCNMPGLLAACHLHALFPPHFHTLRRGAGEVLSCRGHTHHSVLAEPAQSQHDAGLNGQGSAANLVVVFVTRGGVFKHIRRPGILDGCPLVLVLSLRANSFYFKILN